MDEQTARTYIDRVTDQLAAAVADGDPDAAEEILDRVDAEHPAAAAELTRGVRATSLGPKMAD